MFLHEAVMVGLACGNTEVSSEDLLLRMNKLARVNKSSNQTGYQEEFQVTNSKTPFRCVMFSVKVTKSHCKSLTSP